MTAAFADDASVVRHVLDLEAQLQRAERDREELREHWYRDRDRALAAELDRDRLVRQVEGLTEVQELRAAERAERDKARGVASRLDDECAGLRRDRDRLEAQLDKLATQVQRVRDLPARSSQCWVRNYLTRTDVLAALDGPTSSHADYAGNPQRCQNPDCRQLPGACRCAGDAGGVLVCDDGIGQ